MKNDNIDKRGESKHRGREAASEWLRTADPAETVRVAGYDFDYDLDTLTILRSQGFTVPPSSDVDFSWGFWKKVKGHVVHSVYTKRSGGDQTS